MTTPTNTTGRWQSIEEIKQANGARGNYWFSEGAMHFFHTRIGETIISGRYFVSSERPPHGTRRYTVREAQDDGSWVTVVSAVVFCG